MTQEDSLRALIADLAREQTPVSVSPARLAGILEALLDFSSGTAASIEEDLRVTLGLNQIAGNGSGISMLTEQQAVEIVKNNFN